MLYLQVTNKGKFTSDRLEDYWVDINTVQNYSIDNNIWWFCIFISLNDGLEVMKHSWSHHHNFVRFMNEILLTCFFPQS
jgi:hypothetical protein